MATDSVTTEISLKSGGTGGAHVVQGYSDSPHSAVNIATSRTDRFSEINSLEITDAAEDAEEVGQLTIPATYLDGEVSAVEITSGNEAGYFSVDITGLLSVVGAPLEIGSYPLTVSVTYTRVSDSVVRGVKEHKVVVEVVAAA